MFFRNSALLILIAAVSFMALGVFAQTGAAPGTSPQGVPTSSPPDLPAPTPDNPAMPGNPGGLGGMNGQGGGPNDVPGGPMGSGGFGGTGGGPVFPLDGGLTMR